MPSWWSCDQYQPDCQRTTSTGSPSEHRWTNRVRMWSLKLESQVINQVIYKRSKEVVVFRNVKKAVVCYFTVVVLNILWWKINLLYVNQRILEYHSTIKYFILKLNSMQVGPYNHYSISTCSHLNVLEWALNSNLIGLASLLNKYDCECFVKDHTCHHIEPYRRIFLQVLL